MSEELQLQASLWDHLEDLRKALFRIFLLLTAATVVSFFFYKQLFALFTIPLQNTDVQLALFHPLEGFTTALSLSLWVGISASSPFWLAILLDFIAPALYAKERKILLPLTLTAVFFFLLGALFAHFFTIPLANGFFFAFNESFGANFWSVSQYVRYSAVLMLGNGAAFELIALLLVLIHYGVLHQEFLREKRKMVIIAILILSAILTPPDIFTQLMLAIPLYLFYECGILYARIRPSHE